MRRVVSWVVMGIVGCLALLGLTGCSEGRPAVREIQSEFESLGFEFEVWDLRDNASVIGLGCDKLAPSLIGDDGVNVGLASRLDIQLDIEDCDSPAEGADWSSVSLSFDDSLAAWRNPPDYARRRVEYINTLISLLIPDMKNEVLQWIANTASDIPTHMRRFDNIPTHTQRFGKMTVDARVESSFTWGITFRPDKD